MVIKNNCHFEPLTGGAVKGKSEKSYMCGNQAVQDFSSHPLNPTLAHRNDKGGNPLLEVRQNSEGMSMKKTMSFRTLEGRGNERQG